MMLFVYFVLGVGLGYTLRAVSARSATPDVRPFMTPETVLVLEDGNRVRWGDIPADKAARAAWLDKYCKCGKTHA